MDEDMAQESHQAMESRTRSRSPIHAHDFQNDGRHTAGEEHGGSNAMSNQNTGHGGPDESAREGADFDGDSREDDGQSGERQRYSSGSGHGARNRDRGSRGGGGDGDEEVLHVTALNPSTRDADLQEAFAVYGRVKSARVMRDPHTQESRGFGFVTMYGAEAAAMCIAKLNSSTLNGKQIVVAKARRNRAHSPTPGRYRGHKSFESIGGGGGPPRRDSRDLRDSRNSFASGGYGGGVFGGRGGVGASMQPALMQDVADPLYRQRMIDFHTTELNRLYDYERELDGRRDPYRDDGARDNKRYSARDMGGRGGSSGYSSGRNHDPFDRRSVAEPLISNRERNYGGGGSVGGPGGRESSRYTAGSGGSRGGPEGGYSGGSNRGEVRVEGDRDYRMGGGGSGRGERRERSRSPYRM
ncbi:hypothetical protein SARC_05377 [Sphaeroforma arctica JP610]|uniref:RRM domain-containing protein n=1 Tax=Sphaeroforma arctica JP610 TaxID=667725 RepID=A0A0L0G2B8_9EUKA|nr:hypothetical protein SARC_05377 [Sphaeroforma arctica JP610]KNC82338.1 hypothetical protein SARC_05377 [Sphaeroforma arctica JP610]|eukprot:XP_014156240.1 hypothetical protein SARC_05377 [Sphaeroforma arctica JP610]